VFGSQLTDIGHVLFLELFTRFFAELRSIGGTIQQHEEVLGELGVRWILGLRESAAAFVVCPLHLGDDGDDGIAGKLEAGLIRGVKLSRGGGQDEYGQPEQKGSAVSSTHALLLAMPRLWS
jgi:hypothetical protein